MEIDLNCDLGEGCPHDAELMPLITSANIACGGHAGDLALALDTLLLAKRHGVQVGAHPGFLDRAEFGRREHQYPPERIHLETWTQVTALVGLARIADVKLRYVKPHGALYNMACRDAATARPLVHAVEEHDLALMGLPGCVLSRIAERRCPYIAEGFADRRYLPDGSLVPRTQPNSHVEDEEEAVRQALWLVRERGVQTLCVHGDNPKALAFVVALREGLQREGCTIRPFSIL